MVMNNLLARWFVTAISFLLISAIVPGVIVDGLYIALIISVVWGIFNIIVRPILILLTLPITIITLGLFTFIINAFLFWFISTFIEGFYVEGFWAALIGTLIISIISFYMNKWFYKKGNRSSTIMRKY